MMKPYYQYVEDILSGKIPSGKLMKLACERFNDFRNREDMYLDEDCIDKCVAFIGQMKHFLGKSAKLPFVLEPWQQFIIANVLGFKWKSSGFRVCNECYLQIARKAGKDALIGAICDYLLVADGEQSPEIVVAANSTDQAKIAFNYITNFGKSLDPSGKVLKYYRNYIKTPANNGMVKVISSDPSRADGLNISTFVLDEFHESRDRKMYDVLKSSQGMRQQPLAIIITTAGFNLDGPCHDMYTFSIEILNKIKSMDNFFPFIFQLDEEDDWTDKKNFMKCQPNLGVTVTEEFMLQEVNKAKMDSTALTGVLTKTFNRWCQSKVTWLPQELIAQHMKPIDLEEFRGMQCIIGCDLSTVSDFSSITVFLPPGDDGMYRFKTYTFLPNDSIENHPNRMLYEKFIQEGSMIVTNGNVCDYDYILYEIHKINQICPVAAIYLDKWNASQFQINLTNAGYNVQEFSQAVGNYNSCVKEFERLIKEGKVILDRSANVLWQFGNASLKGDINGNVKPTKESSSKKIDSVISITTSLGGWLKVPLFNDFDIIFA